MRIAGAGIGLRQAHFQAIQQDNDKPAWLEVLADHYLFSKGLLMQTLENVLGNTPRVMHCTGISIAGTDPLDLQYLEELRRLDQLIQPTWISDHLSASQLNGVFYPDLLPFPLTTESLAHVCRRVDAVQTRLKKPFLLENPVVYAIFKGNAFTEAEFLATVCKQTGCGILLDINNLYVNQINFGISAESYFETLDKASVKQMHLAGHVVYKNFLVDTHSQAVQAPVWDLYQSAIQTFGAVPTCIEWDSDIPSWATLKAEANKIQEVCYETC